jgi:hypothetical protein
MKFGTQEWHCQVNLGDGKCFLWAQAKSLSLPHVQSKLNRKSNLSDIQVEHLAQLIMESLICCSFVNIYETQKSSHTSNLIYNIFPNFLLPILQYSFSQVPGHLV